LRRGNIFKFLEITPFSHLNSNNVMSRKILILLALTLFFSLPLMADDRGCYPWQNRLQPYLKTQLTFYELYQKTFNEGGMNQEGWEVNVGKIRSNLKTSLDFIKTKELCTNLATSDLEQERVVKWMNETLQAMQKHQPVKLLEK